jgi:aryl-alcohol dehydrogenase-like predicted oxidoreductase
MADVRRGPVSRRRPAGLACSLSSLGWALGDPLPGSLADPTPVAMLRRGWDAGVTTFDLTGARRPEGPAALLLRAFPESEIEVMLDLGSSAAPSTDVAGGLAKAVRHHRDRLPRRAQIVAISSTAADRTDPDADLRAQLVKLAADGRIAGWGIQGTAEGVPAGAGAPGTSRPGLWSVPLSLLEPGLAARLPADAESRGVTIVATDPLAGGRLDGSRFSSALADRTPGAAPPTIRSLHEEYDRVVRLGFLTAGRRRTLAQAALAFDLAWPWVASVSVPLPRPERLDELLAVESVPPLSPEETDAVLSARSDPSPSPRDT